jgi:tetratricopeptide (TPR) repeat protein
MALFSFSLYTPKQFSLLGIALCLTPLTFAADLQPAITAFNEANYSKAKPLFEVAAKDTATKNDALYYLGRIAIQEEGDADKAKGYLDQSVDLEPNASDEYYWLAVVYGELARKVNIFKQASYASSVHKYYQLAVDADPKNIAARRGLFLFYVIAPGIMGGGIDKAEKTLSDIRKLSPVDADVEQLDWYGRKEESEKQLAQAKFLIATYPKSAEALFQAAHTFRNQQKLDSAITGFELASKLPITQQNRMFVETSIFQFGETCQWASVRTDDAIASVEKYIVIKTEVKNTELNWPRWTLAKLYYQKGDMEKFQSLRKQLDPAFIKQNQWMKDDIERFDKNSKGKS